MKGAEKGKTRREMEKGKMRKETGKARRKGNREEAEKKKTEKKKTEKKKTEKKKRGRKGGRGGKGAPLPRLTHTADLFIQRFRMRAGAPKPQARAGAGPFLPGFFFPIGSGADPTLQKSNGKPENPLKL